MKNYKIIINVILINIVFTFASCEKNSLYNDKELGNNNKIIINPDYEIVNPNWRLINENYVDANGNRGMLFQNEKNNKEKLFEI